MGCCITNGMEAEIRDSTFKSNNTSDKAGCINNEFKSKLKLTNIQFKDNDADVDGGVIYNYGEIEIGDSKFANNFSGDEGGAINSRTSGEIMISNSQFIENESKNKGGAIFNYGQIDMSDCRFIKNNAKIRSGAIEHTRPLDNRKETYLKVSNTEFLNNDADDNKSIFSYEGADVDITDCKFKERLDE
jgi:predicted outer membrane repeat protein